MHNNTGGGVGESEDNNPSKRYHPDVYDDPSQQHSASDTVLHGRRVRDQFHNDRPQLNYGENAEDRPGETRPELDLSCPSTIFCKVAVIELESIVMESVSDASSLERGVSSTKPSSWSRRTCGLFVWSL